MKYKLNPQLSVIKSQIVLIIADENGAHTMEREFINGEELIHEEFNKYYLVDAIEAVDSNVVIRLKVNDRINDTNWAGEDTEKFGEEPSFFN